MSKQIPERTIQYNLYDESTQAMIGLVTVDLPELTAITSAVSGAGIAGEYESTTIGNFSSMTTTLNFRTIVGSFTNFFSMKKAHKLQLRAAIQKLDTATGATGVSKVVISMTTKTKNPSLGTMEQSAESGSSVELEVMAIRIKIDDKDVLEYDKLNSVYKVNGVDELQEVRDAI